VNIFHHTIIILLAFACYYVISFRIAKKVADTLVVVLWSRIVGFLLLSIPAWQFFQQTMLMITREKALFTVLLSVVLCELAILVNAQRKRNKLDLVVYPHIRHNQWTPTLVFINVLTWMLYLLPYEFVMRGTFLHHLLTTGNLWQAFAINAVVYSLAHAPQGWRETLVSFPFGILLCSITYVTGNFWSAYIIHVALAVSNDFYAIKNNPSMNFSFLPTTPSWSTKKNSP
jgi:membrane protease YdiL (CAAX protease family)